MIKGGDLIQLANRWSMLPVGNGGGEAVWRTAIGRAYYGAFHLSRDFLGNLGITNSSDGKSEHQFIQRALQHAANTQAAEVGMLLTSLHEYRKSADYDLGITQNGEQRLALQSVEMANKIRSLIDSIDDSQHTTIRTSIRDWQRIIAGRTIV